MRVPVPGRAAPVVKAVSMCNFGKMGSHMIIFPGEASTSQHFSGLPGGKTVP